MSIADFIADKMTAYMTGGMSAEAAAGFTRGELSAIYKGNHYGRDAAGQWRQTPPPETLETAAALAKGEAAITAFLFGYSGDESGAKTDYGEVCENKPAYLTENAQTYGNAPDGPPMPRYEGIQALSYITAHGIPLIGAYPSGAMLAKQEPENFTTDPAEIAALMAGEGNHNGLARGTAISRFYFIPADAGLLCLDIDRKPGKPDGLQELYKLFPKDILPRELQDIDRFFPCYVSTPSGGYHLYFRYEGPPIKKTDLAPEIEVKYGRPGLTAPGSRKENGFYILHGNLESAPPLYGIIRERIAELQKQKETRAVPQGKPERIAADRPAPRRAWESPDRQRITLDTLADEAAATYSGHHDRQVSFAGKVYRLQEAARQKGNNAGDFTATAALSYAKSRPDIFGNGADTEGTIKSVFNDNGGI